MNQQDVLQEQAKSSPLSSLGELPDPVTLSGYQRATKRTDKMPAGDLSTPILGLFGEVGSVVAILKKRRRDTVAYPSYETALLEELGDVLWYFTTIASRAGLDLSVLAQRVSRRIDDWDEVGHDEFGCFADLQSARGPATDAEVEQAMLELAVRAGSLVSDLHGDKMVANRDVLSAHLVFVLRAVIQVAETASIDLQVAAANNIEKVFSRWPLEENYPVRSDRNLDLNERFPKRFTMYIGEQTVNGKTHVIQKRNGVIVGDRLTDNKAPGDDYRFHDVFHLAYAVYLGWSPVLRALFRVKRKSQPSTDENEDGARAIIIEEGIATFVFGRALARGLFADLDHLDYDLLKLVKDLAQGYEPDQCALWQWERAILEGFAVFRELKKHRRGYVKADLEAHTLTFEPGEDREHE